MLSLSRFKTLWTSAMADPRLGIVMLLPLVAAMVFLPFGFYRSPRGVSGWPLSNSPSRRWASSSSSTC